MTEKIHILVTDLGQELVPAKINKAIAQAWDALKLDGRAPTSFTIMINGDARPWRFELRTVSGK